MRGRTFGVAVVSALATASAAWGMSFGDNFGRKITPLGTALARSIGAALPVTTASPGIIYTFAPEMGVPERETVILGQLFLERAETIGRGRSSISLSYQRFKVATLNGDDIGELRDMRPIIIDSQSSFTIPRFGIDLDTHHFTANATLGVTDDLDVNLTVPLVYSEFRFRLQEKDLMVGKKPRLRAVDRSSTKLAFGDIFLRAKHRFLHGNWGQLALGAVLRLPSGNEENFQGTGALGLAPLLYVSSKSLRPTRWLEIQGYLNAGIDFNADDVDRSEPRYGIGLDCRLGERVSAGVAVLGRHALRRTARPGAFDFRRVKLQKCTDPRDFRTCETFSAPLFGIRDRRPDFYDFSIGGRVNLWRDTVIGVANVIVPLNEDGFRAEVIPLIGIEAAF